jgi:hypothetical protein
MIFLFIIFAIIIAAIIVAKLIAARSINGRSEYTDFDLFYKEYADKRFTKSEIKLIYDAMDRTKYDISEDRYLDLKRIKNEILKLRGKNQKLSKIRITHVLESFPPQNFYEYSFI